MDRKVIRSESATKAQILDAAIRLFGDRSFDAVSVRDITSKAKANLGAVNYHFVSKLNLIREVLKTLASPINEARLTSLNAYETSLNGGRPDLETLIRILVEPFVRSAKDRGGRGIYYPRLMMLARTLPGDLIGSYLSEQHDAMARQFVKAIGRALPNLDEEEIFWRYDFAIGSTLNIVGDAYRSHRLRRLSGGQCDTDDADRIVDELVAFVSAGMRGAAPARRKKPLMARATAPKAAKNGERRQPNRVRAKQGAQ
jgi:AcrR family transcriptional regulator